MVQEKDYLTIKDVAEMLDTEAYVLRFYEKELNLDIKRNNKGHRAYTLEDVEMFRKIQDMREQGLQLKAIESIVHDESSEEAKETYEQLSGISVATHAITPIRSKEVSNIDITNADDEKVKQFTCMMKEMLKQALCEYNEETHVKINETIKQEVESAVDEKIAEIEEQHAAKDEEYYKKLDETMREVQRIRKEIFEAKEEQQPKKVKTSFWSRLFKEKDQPAQM